MPEPIPDQYAIPRVGKITREGLGKTHAARAENGVVPPHAIPSAPAPQVLYNAAPTGMTFKQFVEATYDQAIKDGNVYRPRKDQVLAIEGLLTASPGFFRPDAPGEAGVYTEESVRVLSERGLKFLIEKFGARLIRVELQLDEVTPHLQFAYFPIDERGKWAAKNVTKRGHLKALWTDWHKAMADLGLKRGLAGSIGRHVPVRVFYKAIDEFEAADLKVGEIVALVPPRIPAPSPIEIRQPAAFVERANNRLAEWAKSTTERIHVGLRPIVAAAAKMKLAKRRSVNDRMTTKHKNRRIETLEQELLELHERFSAPISVAAVKERLGYVGKVGSKPASDAVEFLQQAEGLASDQALGWLAIQYGPAAAAATAAERMRARVLALAPKLPQPKLPNFDEVRTGLEAQLSAFRADVFHIVVRNRSGDTKDPRFVGKQGAKRKDWLLVDILEALPHLKTRSVNELIQIVPVSATYEYLLVRDLSAPATLAEFEISPCALLQVAPDLYDAVLRLPVGALDAERKAALKEIIKELGGSTIDIDAGSPLPMVGFRDAVRTKASADKEPPSFHVDLILAEDVDFLPDLEVSIASGDPQPAP
jgi:hypothetical protein